MNTIVDSYQKSFYQSVESLVFHNRHSIDMIKQNMASLWPREATIDLGRGHGFSVDFLFIKINDSILKIMENQAFYGYVF